MLLEREAIERACLFFTMNGGVFVTDEVKLGEEYHLHARRLLSRAHFADGVFLVFFEVMLPPGISIEPGFCVVEVNAETGDCSYGVVM